MDIEKLIETLGFPLDQRHGRGGHRHRVRPGGDWR